MPLVSGARRGQPLFELLRESPGSARGGASSEGSSKSRVARGGELRIPLSTAYIGIALLIGVLLLVWVVGHKVGYEAGKREITRGLSGQDLGGVTIADPLEAGRPGETPSSGSGGTRPAGDPAGRPAANRGGDERAGGVKLPEPPVAGPRGGSGEPVIISPRGLLSVDPRTPGTNYLVLATLDEAAASDAVQFLAANGLESIAVPTGPGSDRYRVVSLGLAVPSGQYQQMGDQRRAHERVVGDLGAKWLREQRGASDFSRPQWALYSP